MAMITQEIFDSVVKKAPYKTNGEGFRDLLELYLSLSDAEKESLDFKGMHDSLIFHVENGDVPLNIAYALCDGDEVLIENINELAKKSNETRIIHQYIMRNEVDDSDFVELSIRAVKNVLPDVEIDNAALLELRGIAVERGLLDDVVTGIKTSGDVETVVCGALCYETSLIDEVFGGKANMYLYLESNTFTDDECINFFLERLLTMDDSELEKSLDSKAQAIDAKIKEKKI